MLEIIFLYKNQHLEECNKELKSIKFVKFNDDECLPWCDDNKDLGNIICPIVIHPKDLKDIIDENLELKVHNELLMDMSYEMKEGKPGAFYRIKDARNTTPEQSPAEHDKQVAIDAVRRVSNFISYEYDGCMTYSDVSDALVKYIEQLNKETK